MDHENEREEYRMLSIDLELSRSGMAKGLKKKKNNELSIKELLALEAESAHVSENLFGRMTELENIFLDPEEDY